MEAASPGLRTGTRPDGAAVIRRATPADSAAIAVLHRRQISWGLLSHLGASVVTAFYRTLLGTPLGFGFVAERQGCIVGFATGVMDWRRFYRTFLRTHAVLAVRVASSMVGRGRWRRLVETTRYAASGTLPPAELVAIALDPDVRGTGCGDRLVRAVLDEFAARRAPAVRVTAGGGNAAANRLYERMGFRLHTTMEIHPGEPSAVYVITLP